MTMLKDVFQVAYVTNDMSFALDLFKHKFSIGSWKIYEGARQEFEGGYLTNDAAVAFAGGRQIEVIAPTGGDDGFYRDPLPAGRPAVRFHHHGYLCGDEARMQEIEAELRGFGTPIPVRGRYATLSYLYADTRETLGHYLEYICLGDNPDFFADVPRY